MALAQAAVCSVAVQRIAKAAIQHKRQCVCETCVRTVLLVQWLRTVKLAEHYAVLLPAVNEYATGQVRTVQPHSRVCRAAALQ
jgi:hypothetical protein